MKPIEAAKVVAMLATAYSVPAWSDATQDLFRLMLADLDCEATQAAVLALIRTTTERPTIADIRDAVCKQLAAGGMIPDEPDADQAWGHVQRAILAIGSYGQFPNTYPAV